MKYPMDGQSDIKSHVAYDKKKQLPVFPKPDFDFRSSDERFVDLAAAVFVRLVHARFVM